RQDGDRVDVALVEDTQDQIDDHERRQDQQRHGRQRLLERLRGALEARAQRRRRAEVDHGLLHRIGRLAERDTLRQVERNGDRRELTLMADRQRPHRRAGPLRKGRQRHLFAGQRRLDVDVVQRVDRALQLRQHLEDDVVAVELGEVLRHLALAERVIERVVDQLRLDAVARGGVAVDLQLDRGAVGLLVGG
ncbi:hypothetical protein chiPu_0032550, partial [Chiloscyllium punctatum]|nr:hypothetical protein [Chiloscyllium punctatum]